MVPEGVRAAQRVGSVSGVADPVPVIPAGPAPRLALGVIVPYDMELDSELWRWAPADVDLQVARTPYIDDGVTVEMVQELSDDDVLVSGTKSLLGERVDTVAYACTSASFVGGVEGERRIRRTIESAGVSRAVTPSGALLDALEVLGVERLAIATPYLPEVSAFLGTYLAEAGATVEDEGFLGLDRGISQVPYERTAALARSVDHPDAQAIFLSCTNLPTYDLIAPLERELGKPILSANQVMMWGALRAMGRQAIGPGQRLIEAG